MTRTLTSLLSLRVHAVLCLACLACDATLIGFHPGSALRGSAAPGAPAVAAPR